MISALSTLINILDSISQTSLYFSGHSFPASSCNNMQMTLLIFMNFSDYENCFWALTLHHTKHPQPHPHPHPLPNLQHSRRGGSA